MKVLDFDGKKYTLKLPRRENIEICSIYHKKCREVLRELYPFDNIFEEVQIPNHDLYLDFIVPLRKLVVEVQGQQHYAFNKFFHKTLGDFRSSKIRDSLKADWCKLNNFVFVQLDYREVENWRQQILDSFKE